MPRGIGYIEDGTLLTIEEFCIDYCAGSSVNQMDGFVKWCEDFAVKLRTYTEWNRTLQGYYEARALTFS